MKLSTPRRLCIAAMIGCIAAVIGCWINYRHGNLAGDLYYPVCGSFELLQNSHVDLLDGKTCDMPGYPPNPPTTVYAVLPFVALFGAVSGIFIFGLGSGLLAYLLLRDGPPWRLLLFCSAPYAIAMQWLQWSPLMTAVYLLPGLLPLTLVKPQIGLPVALLKMTWRRAIACAAVVIATLVLDPTWPLRFYPLAQRYSGFIPLATLPVGLLILLAVLRWREERARLLLLMAAVPQRGWYDLSLLWLVPQTWQEMLILTLLSWVSFISTRLLGIPYQVPIIVCIYLPALVMVMRQPQTSHGALSSESLHWFQGKWQAVRGKQG